MSEVPRLYPHLVLPAPETLIRPPLTQRVAQFWFVISRHDFDRLLPSWLDKTMADRTFEQQQVTDHWEFRVEQQPGMPPKPKATLTHVPKLTRATNSPLAVEVFPPANEQGASVRITQPWSDQQPSRFEDFQNECCRCLESLLAHLQLNGVSQLTLSYRNVLTRDRYPAFWKNHNSLQLGELMNTYASMPNPPEPVFMAAGGLAGQLFAIEFTRQVLAPEQRALSFKLGAETPPQPQAIRATFTIRYASRVAALKTDGIEAVLADLAIGHAYIFEEFCAQVTPKALASFAK